MNDMSWVDKKEAATSEERSKEYFDIGEGENKFFMLTYAAPQPLKWTGTKYEPAEEGDSNVSIKGVCWVLQDGIVKLAKLPYTAVKQLRAYQNDPEWELEDFPWENQVNLVAKGAGTKEVEYTTTLSPRKSKIPSLALEELAKKPSPEEMIEKLKGLKGQVSQRNEPDTNDPSQYPAEGNDLSPF